MSTIDFHRRKAFIAALIGSNAINYVENDTITTPHTSGDSICMPTFKATWDRDTVRSWMFSLIHECYHNLPDNKPDFDILKEHQIGAESEFGFALNVVVDHNIEQKQMGILEGADKYCRETYLNICTKLPSGIAKFPSMLGALIGFDMHCRSHWCGIPDLDYRSLMPPEMQEKYDKLLPFEEEYCTGRMGGSPNYDLTLRMLEDMGEDTDELKQAANEAYQSGEGEGEEGEGEGEEGDGEGSGEARGAGEDGEGEDSKAKAERFKAQYERVNPEGHTHTEAGTAQPEIEYTEEDLVTGTSDYKMDSKIQQTKAAYTPNSTGNSLLNSTTFTLSNKVRNALKVMSQARWEGGKKKGKLKAKSLATIPSGNDRVFRTKENRNILDTAVSVLVDASGSMDGTKWDKASQAALMINNCLNKVGIPVEIGCFTTDGWVESRGTTCRHTLMTTHAGKTNDIDIANAFGSLRGELYENNDGESLLWLHERLLKQKQKRKVLIVLSDGMPSGKSYAAGFTTKVVKDIEKYSPVELYAIGIEDSSVERFYTNTKVIDRANELEAALLDVLKESLIN